MKSLLLKNVLTNGLLFALLFISCQTDKKESSSQLNSPLKQELNSDYVNKKVNDGIRLFSEMITTKDKENWKEEYSSYGESIYILSSAERDAILIGLKLYVDYSKSLASDLSSACNAYQTNYDFNYLESEKTVEIETQLKSYKLGFISSYKNERLSFVNDFKTVNRQHKVNYLG